MDVSDLWKEAARSLKRGMAKATFEQHFATSHAVSIDDDELVIAAPPLSREWLEFRYADKIREAASAVAGTPLRVRFVPTDAAPHEAAPSHGQPVISEGIFGEARDAIRDPGEFARVPEYFRHAWVRRLGPVLAWFVSGLRQQAFHEHKSKQHQPDLECTLGTYAAEIGVSEDTLWRSRAELYCAECETPHPVIDHFVPAIRPIVKWSKARHKNIRTGTAIQVLMLDPLTPPDEAAVREKLGQPRPLVRDLRCPIPRSKVEALLASWPPPDKSISRQEIEELLRRLRC